FIFFQAEDGIRDFHVTGVQTCALPICIAGCVARGMALLVCGAVLLGIGELYGSPSFLTFILPMWVVAVGIVFKVSVTANGALARSEERRVGNERSREQRAG